MEDAKKEKFELVMLDKYLVLFTCARIERSTLFAPAFRGKTGYTIID